MCEIKWRKLTAKCMPPERETFLLWMGLRDSDGGFPAVARLGRDSGGNPYIRLHGADDVWKIMFECEWRGMMWTEIPVPLAAQKKRRNEAAR